MASQKTKNSHVIPVGYLKKFAINPLVKKPRVVQYDITEQVKQREVFVRNICHANYLYEIRDEHGKIILKNAIENSLKIIEDNFYSVRDNLISGIFTLNPYNFLSKHYRKTILIMMISQLLRYEQTLRDSRCVGDNLFWNDSNIKDNQKDIISKLVCLPMFLNYDNVEMTKELRAFRRYANNPIVLTHLMRLLEDYNISFGFKRNANIFTCDNPVIVRCFDFSKIDLLIYPISSEHVIFIYSDRIKFPHNNCVFEMTDGEIDFVKKELIFNAKRFIYSNHELTDKEIGKIRVIRNYKDKCFVKGIGQTYVYVPEKDKGLESPI